MDILFSSDFDFSLNWEVLIWYGIYCLCIVSQTTMYQYQGMELI